MKADEESRSDDKLLILKYLSRDFGIRLPPEAESAFLKLSVKSIINERQHIQNVEGKYLSKNPEVRDKRKKMSKAVREAHRRRTNA